MVKYGLKLGCITAENSQIIANLNVKLHLHDQLETVVKLLVKPAGPADPAAAAERAGVRRSAAAGD
jgi:hypothetical protein